MSVDTLEFDLQWEGRRCRVEQLASKASHAVAVRLLNLLGRAVRQAGQSATVESIEAVGLGALLEGIDTSVTDWLEATFSKVTYIEREAGSEDWAHPTEFPDLVWGGSDGSARWIRWLIFCLDTSCSPFFYAAWSELKARQTRIMKVTAENASPMTSHENGSSTGSRRAGSTATA
jgi:hypothetical protein